MIRKRIRDMKAADLHPSTEAKASLPEDDTEATTEAAEATVEDAPEPEPEPEPEPAKAAAWEFGPWCDRVEKTAQMNKKTIPEGADLRSLFDAGDNPWQAYLRLCK